jgi:hypothetical protein
MSIKLASNMPVLKWGDSGEYVEKWQEFLISQNFSLYPYGADGDFKDLTQLRTREFQIRNGLEITGQVDLNTWNCSFTYEYTCQPRLEPALPDFTQLKGQKLIDVFGKFNYIPTPSKRNPEGIRILGNWVKENIVFVNIPQLKNIKGAPRSCNVYFHKKAKDQLIGLWQEWEDEDLLKYILTWEGSWNPRFIRGSRTRLSNHSRGTAFDINARWNWRGAKPADWGKKGCVKYLIDIASKWGFWWGGFWDPFYGLGEKVDGMHMETAVIL